MRFFSGEKYTLKYLNQQTWSDFGIIMALVIVQYHTQNFQQAF